MKQNISIQDLDQLSEKGKEKLRKWWKPKDGDIVTRTDYQKEFHICEGGLRSSVYWGLENAKNMAPYSPLLSIGQMFEFLDEYREHDGYSDDWLREIFQGVATGNVQRQYEGELCDALFEAVKKVLEK